MRLLTKLELDKLIRRKYLLLGGLLLLGYSSFMFFSCCMNSSPTFPVETADGVEVTGRAAALYNKSVYEQYAGELTDEAVAHVLDDFVDLRDAHGEHSFNWPVIYDNFSIFRAADQADRKRSEYGYISVADAGVLSFHLQMFPLGPFRFRRQFLMAQTESPSPLRAEYSQSGCQKAAAPRGRVSFLLWLP